MTNSNELITSPLGTIQFMALAYKVRKSPEDTERSVYTIRLEFDGNTKEGKAFRKTVESINANLIGTKNASAPGHFTVSAKSKFDVKVLDADGTQLLGEEIPKFTKGSTGQAVMMVKPYTGNALGGTLNLVGVGIHALDLVEAEETQSSGAIDALREALKQHQ